MTRATLDSVHAVKLARPGIYFDGGGNEWILTASGTWLDRNGNSRPPIAGLPPHVDQDHLADIWLSTIALGRSRPSWWQRRTWEDKHRHDLEANDYLRSAGFALAETPRSRVRWWSRRASTRTKGWLARPNKITEAP